MAAPGRMAVPPILSAGLGELMLSKLLSLR